MTPEERAARVALSLVPAIGPARMTALLNACSTALGAHSAPFAFLCAIPGISRACATALKQVTPEHGARVIQRTTDLGGSVLLPEDDTYPALLRLIPDPPPVLYTQGDPALARLPAVAIVGSRDHSAYGAEVCRQVAGGAAGSGIAVVSGMARGLDALAHAAALDAGGTTIGVLGNGLGVIYPAANRSLYERVRDHGCLLTEFPPGERPHTGSFPRRNRLISGLARTTVVIEAAAGSGTMITVDTALAQGREVMAVPGQITSPVSVGTNRLIRDGATPLLELDDLLRGYPEVVQSRSGAAHESAGALATAPPIGLSADDRRVLDILRNGPLHVDQMASQLQLAVGEMIGLLVALELRGVVRQRPGGGWWETGAG